MTKRKPCAGCGSKNYPIPQHPLLGVACCQLCQSDPRFMLISEYWAWWEFHLSKVELICLRHVHNPPPQGGYQHDPIRDPDENWIATLEGMVDDGYEPDNIYLRCHVEELAASRQGAA